MKLGIGNLREKMRRRRNAAKGLSRRGGGETILVADADRDSLAMTCTVLREGGYAPIAVDDGADALAAFSQQADAIGAVLTDVSMPTLNGVDLAKVIRRLRPAARIMAAGANDAESEFDELRQIGVTSFLPKPCAARDLLSGIRRLLDQS